ncbi:MAG: N-acetylneuraminate synthase family protein [Phycisphaerales bacterium]|nr:N-acetylneuraminate synthase family protein [Phycisphaerales bacterium]
MIHFQNKSITRDGPPFVLAEIGVNHNGDVRVAERLIDAAKSAGADAVKFQLFDAKMLLARQAGLVAYQEKAADSVVALLEPLQLTSRQMACLIEKAHAENFAAIVTPFSPELVGACVEMKADAIKLASPDLVNRPLLEEAIGTGLPLIVSTGAADLGEVERTVGWVFKAGAIERTVVLHCVSSYPTVAEHATLAAVSVLRQRFPELPIGYSDHTVETLTAALAVAAGACVLEKHLTFSRGAAGPDHAASLEAAQFAEYVAFARLGYAMRGPYVKRAQDLEREVRQQTRQSVVARRDLKAGTVLTGEMLTVKRPGIGIPAADWHQALGKTLAKDVAANSILTPDDLRAT